MHGEVLCRRAGSIRGVHVDEAGPRRGGEPVKEKDEVKEEVVEVEPIKEVEVLEVSEVLGAPTKWVKVWPINEVEEVIKVSGTLGEVEVGMGLEFHLVQAYGHGHANGRAGWGIGP